MPPTLFSPLCLQCEIDGDLDRGVDITLAVERREDNLVAYFDERCQVAGNPPTRAAPPGRS